MFGLFSKKKAMDQDAVSLFVEMSAGDVSKENTEQLLEWAENDPSKLDDLELLSEIWDEVGSVQPDRSIFFEEERRATGWWQGLVSSFSEGWRYPAGAVAAMAMVALVFVTVFDNGPDVTFSSYATARGDAEIVKLADGSGMHLNGLSRIEVAYSDSERRINMLEGEVYYDVSSDRNRPFIVEISGVEVQALGTAFDIEKGKDAVTVIVTEGTVSIGYGGETKKYSAGNKIEVMHGVASDPFKVTKLLLSDYLEAVTWRTGVINFSGESLSLALERINRQSEKPIVLVDGELSEIQIFGSFRQDNIESFLHAIEALYPVKAVESKYRVSLHKRSKLQKQDRAGDGNT